MKKKLFIVVTLPSLPQPQERVYYVYPVQVSTLAGLTRNYIISLAAPAGVVTRNQVRLTKEP